MEGNVIFQYETNLKLLQNLVTEEQFNQVLPDISPLEWANMLVEKNQTKCSKMVVSYTPSPEMSSPGAKAWKHRGFLRNKHSGLGSFLAGWEFNIVKQGLKLWRRWWKNVNDILRWAVKHTDAANKLWLLFSPLGYRVDTRWSETVSVVLCSNA